MKALFWMFSLCLILFLFNAISQKEQISGFWSGAVDHAVDVLSETASTTAKYVERQSPKPASQQELAVDDAQRPIEMLASHGNSTKPHKALKPEAPPAVAVSTSSDKPQAASIPQHKPSVARSEIVPEVQLSQKEPVTLGSVATDDVEANHVFEDEGKSAELAGKAPVYELAVQEDWDLQAQAYSEEAHRLLDQIAELLK